MKAVTLFLYSAGTLLLCTAASKFVSSFGHAAILQMRDPLIGIQFQNLFRLVGTVEFVIGLACCIFVRQFLILAGLVAWLATCFASYRIGLYLIGYHKPCSCLGNLTDALHIPPQTANTTMEIILAYLLLGSYAILFWLWRQKIKASQAYLPVGSV